MVIKMKKFKLIFFLLLLIVAFPACFAETYYNGVPIYNIDYSDIIMKPTYITMSQANYYNDWNFNTNSYTQNNNSNYNYQYNNNNHDSGSIHFIYSSSLNPTYCIPGSSYSICH